MKVLHIIDSGGFYGAESVLLDLCEEQRKNGIDAHVLSIGSHGNYEKAIEKRLKEIRVPVHVWRLAPFPNFVASLRKSHWAKSEGFEILHSHGYKGNILFGLLPKALRTLPLITTLHGWTNTNRFSKLAIYEMVDRISLKLVDKVVLVNPAMTQLPGVRRLNRSKVAIVENGIKSYAVNPKNALSDKLEIIGRESKIIGSIGRLSSEKNFSLLISAFSRLELKDAALVIVGEGPKRKELECLVEDLGIKERVYLPGYIDDAAFMMRYFSIFVNTSISEGLPITILEAMRDRCLVIASDISQNRHVIKDGKNGFIFENGNEESLKELIGVGLDDREAKQKILDSAEECYKVRYSVESMCTKYMNLYERHGLKHQKGVAA